MPLKEGGKGHQQSYDHTTGKYGSGNANATTNDEKKVNDHETNKTNTMKEDEDKNSKSNIKDGVSMLDMLIADEEEAINGYQKAINYFKEKKDDKVVNTLEVILADEREHKQVLEFLKKK